MFHGIKRSDVKKLTPEQKQKNEETLKKIKVIQEQILKIKKDLKYSPKILDMLFKSAVIMPDYPTIWDVRKILIEKFVEQTTDQEEVYNFFKKEIKSMIPIMIKNPKTYLLWYHRIWCLMKILDIEKIRKIPLETCILMPEIKLCNDFFLKDDRNFHCWNYRVNILTLIKKYYSETFDNFIAKELDFTLEKIKKNFSNFSAWHYRAKLIPIHFIQKKINWNTQTALDFFKDDLDLIKKAVYTDPKDQSPWNYHYWIISNFSPIFIENIDISTENNEYYDIKIKYSNVFKIGNVLDIEKIENFGGEKNEKMVLNTNNFSDFVEIKIKKEILDKASNDNKLIIENKVLDNINYDLDNLTLVTNKVCFTKENLNLPKVEIMMKDGKINYEIKYTNFEKFQIDFLNEQVDMIKELIDKSKDFFIENAHHRLAQIYNIFYQVNKYNEDKSNADGFRGKQIEEYKILSENSKRMNSMYKDILKGFDVGK